MNKLLLIEDDGSLGYILREYLQMHEFQVEWVKDGEEGLKSFEREPFDLCILDVMMPKKDGFTVAQEIKTQNPLMPIIFLTAKSLKIDKLKGFKMGADDYIVKPVDEEELIARIQAVLRRSGLLQAPKQESYQIGLFHFNPKNQELDCPDETIHLTQKESKILEMLAANPNELVDRDAILKLLWGDSTYFNRRSMDVFISKLRKYLASDSSVSIDNVHGKGFILKSEG